MPELKIRLKIYKKMKKEYEDEIRKLRGEKDVTEINHLRHAELAWSFC